MHVVSGLMSASIRARLNPASRAGAQLTMPADIAQAPVAKPDKVAGNLMNGIFVIYANESHVDKVLQGPIGKEISAIARKKTGVEFVA